MARVVHLLDYGAGITLAREAAGLTKGELARRVNVDASFVTHIEAGRRAPSLEMFEKIALACTLTPVRLMMLCPARGDW